MQIDYLVMDVDGTLTDGKIYMGLSGETIKAFNVKDGYGISVILNDIRIIPVILTSRKSQIVVKRCEELKISKVFQGCNNKLEKLREIMNNDFSRIAYIGDDITDVECMIAIKRAGGIVGCPSDAVNEVRQIADYVSDKAGGEGAVRSFIDWIVDYASGN